MFNNNFQNNTALASHGVIQNVTPLSKLTIVVYSRFFLYAITMSTCGVRMCVLTNFLLPFLNAIEQHRAVKHFCFYRQYGQFIFYHNHGMSSMSSEGVFICLSHINYHSPIHCWAISVFLSLSKLLEASLYRFVARMNNILLCCFSVYSFHFTRITVTWVQFVDFQNWYP